MINSFSRVLWCNSDQNLEKFPYFRSFSFARLCVRLIFLALLELNLLYLLAKESPKSDAPRKSIGHHNEKMSKVIGIPPCGIIPITSFPRWGNSDHLLKIAGVLSIFFPMFLCTIFMIRYGKRGHRWKARCIYCGT